MEKTAVELVCGINWTRRRPVDSFQKGCGLLGYLLILLQVIIAITFISRSNSYVDFNLDPSSDKNPCSSGYLPYYAHSRCVDESLMKEMMEFQCPRWGDGRLLSMRTRSNSRLEAMKEEAQDLPQAFFLTNSGAENNEEQQDIDFFTARGIHEEHDATHIMRRLAENTEKFHMWDRMAQNGEIPGVLVPLILVVGVLWLLLMKSAAKCCIWSAVVFSVIIFIFLAIFPAFLTFHVCRSPMREWAIAGDKYSYNECIGEGGRPSEKSGGVIIVFLIPAIVISGLAIWKRADINIAAKCLGACCLSLFQNPFTFVSCLGVYAYFLFYIGLWIGGILSIFNSYAPRCDEAGMPILDLRDPEGAIIEILALLLPLSYVYFEMMIVVVVACGVGGWYFQEDPERPHQPSLEGLKWAYSTSSGAVVLATVITTPIIWIRNYVHSTWAKVAMCPCLPCSWLYWILYILWCCVLRAYLAFTRFMLISHTFHGGDIFQVARKAWIVLKKHLGGAVVTDTVADMVLHGGVTIISTVFGIGAWAWMEKAVGSGFLSEIFTGTDTGGVIVLVVFLLLIFMWFVRHSLFTILLIAIVGNSIADKNFHGFLCGLFIGAICHVMFSFIAKVIHAGMDTIFYCYALEAEFAKLQSHPGLTELRECIKSDIVAPVPDYLKTEDGDYPTKEGNLQNFQPGQGQAGPVVHYATAPIGTATPTPTTIPTTYDEYEKPSSFPTQS